MSSHKCKADGCSEWPTANGYCQVHRNMANRPNAPARGAASRSPPPTRPSAKSESTEDDDDAPSSSPSPRAFSMATPSTLSGNGAGSLRSKSPPAGRPQPPGSKPSPSSANSSSSSSSSSTPVSPARSASPTVATSSPPSSSAQPSSSKSGLPPARSFKAPPPSFAHHRAHSNSVDETDDTRSKPAKPTVTSEKKDSSDGRAKSPAAKPTRSSAGAVTISSAMRPVSPKPTLPSSQSLRDVNAKSPPKVTPSAERPKSPPVTSTATASSSSRAVSPSISPAAQKKFEKFHGSGASSLPAKKTESATSALDDTSRETITLPDKPKTAPAAKNPVPWKFESTKKPSSTPSTSKPRTATTATTATAAPSTAKSFASNASSPAKQRTAAPSVASPAKDSAKDEEEDDEAEREREREERRRRREEERQKRLAEEKKAKEAKAKAKARDDDDDEEGDEEGDDEDDRPAAAKARQPPPKKKETNAKPSLPKAKSASEEPEEDAPWSEKQPSGRAKTQIAPWSEPEEEDKPVKKEKKSEKKKSADDEEESSEEPSSDSDEEHKKVWNKVVKKTEKVVHKKAMHNRERSIQVMQQRREKIPQHAADDDEEVRESMVEKTSKETTEGETRVDGENSDDDEDVKNLPPAPAPGAVKKRERQPSRLIQGGRPGGRSFLSSGPATRAAAISFQRPLPKKPAATLQTENKEKERERANSESEMTQPTTGETKKFNVPPEVDSYGASVSIDIADEGLEWEQVLQKPEIVFITNGSNLALYEVKAKGKSRRREVFLFYTPRSGGKLGALFWCEQGKRVASKGKSISVHKIVDITTGMHPKIFDVGAAKETIVSPESCFSIVGGSATDDGTLQTFNLEPRSIKEREEWVTALQMMLEHSGMAIAAAPHRERLTVVKNSPIWVPTASDEKIKVGFMNMFGMLKQWKQRFFQVNGDDFEYYIYQIKDKIAFKLAGKVSLIGSVVVEMKGEDPQYEGRQNLFCVKHGKSVLVLQANNAHDVSEWKLYLEHCIEQCSDENKASETFDMKSLPTCSGREGFLEKLGGMIKQRWQLRWFQQTPQGLKYYHVVMKKEKKDPASEEVVTATYELCGQISFPALVAPCEPDAFPGKSWVISIKPQGSIKSYFLASEDEQSHRAWLQSLETQKLAQVKLDAKFQKVGFLRKMGNEINPFSVAKTFKERYFILTADRLRYFKKPTDSEPLGVIPLFGGTKVQEESVLVYKQDFVFSVTPARTNRKFVLSASNKVGAEEWMQAIDSVIQANQTIEDSFD